ncbi:MAG: hypothetical protein ACOYMG_12905 [Candidatus Methylumidiphilus sp.]
MRENRQLDARATIVPHPALKPMGDFALVWHFDRPQTEFLAIHSEVAFGDRSARPFGVDGDSADWGGRAVS